MKILITAFVLLLAANVYTAEEAEAEVSPREQLPASTKRVLTTMDADLEKARQAYLDAVEAAKTKALRGLERQEKVITRGGNVDQMLAFRAVRAEVQNLQVRDFLGNPIEVQAEAAAAPRGGIDLSGTWTYNHNGWTSNATFNEEGVMTLERNGVTFAVTVNGNKITLVRNGGVGGSEMTFSDGSFSGKINAGRFSGESVTMTRNP